jgi:hypothetical protein
MPDPIPLAGELFGRRAPAHAQVILAAAVFEGFIRGHREWSLWEFVGRKTHQSIDVRDLEIWRQGFASRFPAIAQFHAAVAEFFWRDVGGSVYTAHREFEADKFRRFIARKLRRLAGHVPALVALAIEETLPNAIVGRFDDWLLCQGSDTRAVSRKKIDAKLATAFPRSEFRITTEEVRP